MEMSVGDTYHGKSLATTVSESIASKVLTSLNQLCIVLKGWWEKKGYDSEKTQSGGKNH